MVFQQHPSFLLGRELLCFAKLSSYLCSSAPDASHKNAADCGFAYVILEPHVFEHEPLKTLVFRRCGRERSDDGHLSFSRMRGCISLQRRWEPRPEGGSDVSAAHTKDSPPPPRRPARSIFILLFFPVCFYLRCTSVSLNQLETPDQGIGFSSTHCYELSVQSPGRLQEEGEACVCLYAPPHVSFATFVVW